MLWVGAAFSGGTEAPRDWTALFEGQVAVTPIKSDNGLPGVKAEFTVAASTEHIWTVLLDYEHFPKVFKEVTSLRVLAAGPKRALIEFNIDATLRHLTYVLLRQYDRAAGRITWRRDSGDLKRIEGSWQILETPRADHKLLVYRSFVKVGGLMPMALVRRVAMGKARDMGQALRSWIERHPAKPSNS
jgi:uncharacterized membrane protein